jgi:hypothetical protein
MLTKPRASDGHVDSSLYLRKRRRRFSPLLLIGVAVPVVIALIIGTFVVVSRIGSHAAAANPNCSLIVPSNPLSAKGLATPYQLFAPDAAQNGPCNEANAGQSAFVQGVIFDPNTNTFSIYSPLVIDKGTQPAVAPTAPTLPQGVVVGLWFGFNGTNLTLQGTNNNTLRQGQCVNGLNGSVFGQFAYCNAVNFFKSANAAIAAGKVQVPALATAKDGMTCPTTRDFGIIDQDQSDNVQTQYLANGNGQTAQFSTANQAQIQNATPIANPSDNALTTNFVDPALGCQPWTAPDLANNNTMTSALALDELQAAADQKAPIALIPLTDPMTLNNNNQSLRKTNLYRVGVDQTPAANANGASGKTYCQNFLSTGIPRIQLDMPITINAGSPAADQANNLFTFLAMRANMSYTNLNCQNLLNVPNPVTLTTDGNGVVTAATINLPGNAGNGNGNGGTTAGNGGVQQVATGTANITLMPQGGNAQMALNITYPNHPNQQIGVNVVSGSCTSTTVVSSQTEDTDGNGQNDANTVINNLQGLQAIPNNWFVTVTDPTQAGTPVVGCGSVTANGVTGMATLGTVAGTTATCPPATAATPTTTATTGTPAATTTANATPTTAATTGTGATPVPTTAASTTPVATTPAGTTTGTPCSSTTSSTGNGQTTTGSQPAQPTSVAVSTSKGRPYLHHKKKW